MTDADQIVRRAVDAITTIAGKAARFATKLLLAAVVICVGSFLLGVAALSGGIEAVWIVLGVAFGSIAIASAAVARWRVGAVRRHVPELAEEVRTLIAEGHAPARTVIETFTVEPDSAGGPGGARPGTGSTIVMTRRMSDFRGAFGSGLDRTARLGAAVTALTSFPILVLGTVAISLVFAFTGVIFLLALAL